MSELSPQAELAINMAIELARMNETLPNVSQFANYVIDHCRLQQLKPHATALNWQSRTCARQQLDSVGVVPLLATQLYDCLSNHGVSRL